MTDASKAETPLEKLAKRVGLQLDFKDAHGRWTKASPQAIAALLAAIGLAAADDETASRQLTALDAAESGRRLPPVIVAREHQQPLTITLPMPADATPWALELEDGTISEGTAQGKLIVLPEALPTGYHTLTLGDERTQIILAPQRCWLPPTLIKAGKLWGISTQLYLLRSADNWGFGDYGDLLKLARITARHQGDVVGLNPLHAMFLDDPAAASPYSPASRLWLNPLNIDIRSIPELLADEATQALIASQEFSQRLAAVRATPLVDYPAVAALKLEALRSLFDHFLQSSTEQRRHAFARFKEEQGRKLLTFCTFQALRIAQTGLDPARPDYAAIDMSKAAWSTWPQELRGVESPGVERFAREWATTIDFLAWLQWLADSQLAAAAGVAHDLGLEIGLYRDLAVGADANGAETWSNPSVVVAGVHAGAPPDVFNPGGQDWGLPPFNPQALRQEAYASFIALVRANMRHAGGLRIDHVLGLQRLWWVPAGSSPRDGAYMTYPFADLAAILALESHRNRCVVVGEDLGTVPEGFRDRLADYGILSYKLLYFEQDESGAYLPPEAYPTCAMATVSSHDLPTLAGWWAASDIKIREDRRLYADPEEGARQRRQRELDKSALLSALRAAGLWHAMDAGTGAAASVQDEWSGGSAAGSELAHEMQNHNQPIDRKELSLAVHRFLARSHAAIAMVQVDDLMGEADQVNLPSTTDQYPNWRRKAIMTLEELAKDGPATQLMDVVARARQGLDQIR